MNIRYFALICLACSALATGQPYILQLQLPDNIQAKTALRAYYQGNEINLENPLCCQVPKLNNEFAFSILVADDINMHASKGSTIECLKRPENRSFKWFDAAYDKRTGAWRVEERSSDNLPERLPENTLYLLCNPDRVNNVDVISRGRGTTYINVTFTQDMVYAPQDDSAHALLASLDAQAFHAATRKQELHDRYVTVSMLYDTP